jgi:hypothetical protein
LENIKCNNNEAVSKYFPLTAGFKIEEGENYNHPSTISQTYGAGRNTLSISRTKFELTQVLGKRGSFEMDSNVSCQW